MLTSPSYSNLPTQYRSPANPFPLTPSQKSLIPQSKENNHHPALIFLIFILIITTSTLICLSFCVCYISSVYEIRPISPRTKVTIVNSVNNGQAQIVWCDKYAINMSCPKKVIVSSTKKVRSISGIRII